MFNVKRVYGKPDDAMWAMFTNGEVLVTKACLDTLLEGCMEGIMIEERGNTGNRWYLEFVD